MNRAPSPRSSIPAAIRRAAAAWLSLQDGGLDAAQEAELSEWLELDERHAAAFAEINETWNCLDRLETERLATGEPDPNLLFRDAETREPVMRQSRRSRNWSIWRPSLAAGLAAVAALAIGYFGWRRPADVHQAPGADYTCSAVTEIGASRKLDLPDGSIVHLNTDTAVEVAYSAAERRVRLVHGEAHFTVAKNPARPFIVSADCVDVRAVGTAFDVLMEPEVVEVLVTEGKVRVDESVSGRSLLSADATSLSGHDMKGSMTSQESVLAKGEHAIISLAPTVAAHFDVVAMPPAARACVLAWQHERLEFTSTSLGDAAAQFNRYNRHKLVIADPRLREMTYSGTFRCDGYDAFVRLLESHFGVAAERRQSETILRLAH